MQEKIVNHRPFDLSDCFRIEDQITIGTSRKISAAETLINHFVELSRWTS